MGRHRQNRRHQIGMMENFMNKLHLKPLQPFAAQATGIDLREPLTSTQLKAIEDAMDQHAVLVFRNQALTQSQQIAFAKSLGPLDMGLRKLKGGAPFGVR